MMRSNNSSDAQRVAAMQQQSADRTEHRRRDLQGIRNEDVFFVHSDVYPTATAMAADYQERGMRWPVVDGKEAKWRYRESTILRGKRVGPSVLRK